MAVQNFEKFFESKNQDHSELHNLIKIMINKRFDFTFKEIEILGHCFDLHYYCEDIDFQNGSVNSEDYLEHLKEVEQIIKDVKEYTEHLTEKFGIRIYFSINAKDDRKKYIVFATYTLDLSNLELDLLRSEAGVEKFDL